MILGVIVCNSNDYVVYRYVWLAIQGFKNTENKIDYMNERITRSRDGEINNDTINMKIILNCMTKNKAENMKDKRKFLEDRIKTLETAIESHAKILG